MRSTGNKPDTDFRHTTQCSCGFRRSGVAVTPWGEIRRSDLSIGQLIDRLYKVKVKIAEISAKRIKPLKDEQADLESQLIAALDAAGIEQGRGRVATGSISETDVPTVRDWEKVYAWVHRNKAYHLFVRRLSSASFRELLAQRNNRAIPGIEKFTKRSISTRKR